MSINSVNLANTNAYQMQGVSSVQSAPQEAAEVPSVPQETVSIGEEPPETPQYSVPMRIARTAVGVVGGAIGGVTGGLRARPTARTLTSVPTGALSPRPWA